MKEILGCSVCKRQNSSFLFAFATTSILFAAHRFYLLPFARSSVYPTICAKKRASSVGHRTSPCLCSFAGLATLSVTLCTAYSAIRPPPERRGAQVGILAKVAGDFLNHRPVVSALCGHSKQSVDGKPIRRQYGLCFLRHSMRQTRCRNR